MNKRLQPYSDALHEPVAGLQRLRADDFEQEFEDNVADADECTATRWRIIPGVGQIIELSIGYCLYEDRAGSISLYETEAHYNERVLYSAWARFVRGAWVDRCPTEPGLYFARDRDLGRRSVRELRKVDGRLLDVSGGLVPPGRVTCWRGQWWSVQTPQLPNSY